VLFLRHVDVGELLSDGLRGAVKRDGVGRRELPGRDRGGFGEESARFGAPGLLPLLAAVREQVVVPGDPVHGGGERIGVQPALVETVGQITCLAHETFRGSRSRERFFRSLT
jgi:hypothetical protein